MVVVTVSSLVFPADDFHEDDQLRLYRVHDDGSFGMSHARGESGHGKVGCRAPKERVGADHRFDVPVAGRLGLGVFDDRLHDGGTGRQRRGEVVVRGDPGQNPVDGRGFHGADLGQRRDALAQPVTQRACGPAG
jgi:hypothetical protein